MDLVKSAKIAFSPVAGRGLAEFRPVQFDFFSSPTWALMKSRGETVDRRARHTCLAAFSHDGAFCTNCCLGAAIKKLNEKASLYEGHGFSRAVNSLCLKASAAEVRFLRNPQVCGFP